MFPLTHHSKQLTAQRHNYTSPSLPQHSSTMNNNMNNNNKIHKYREGVREVHASVHVCVCYLPETPINHLMSSCLQSLFITTVHIFILLLLLLRSSEYFHASIYWILVSFLFLYNLLFTLYLTISSLRKWYRQMTNCLYLLFVSQKTIPLNISLTYALFFST